MLKRLSTNAAAVAMGEALGALATVGAMALAARALEPEGFGYFVLVVAYTGALELLFTFQSSRVFVRYAAAAEGTGNVADLGAILRFCQALDVVGMLAALVVGFALAGWIAGRIGMVDTQPVYVYCVVLLFGVTGHAQGVLRHFGRFAFVGLHGALSGTLRLVAMAWVVWRGNGSLVGVVGAFLVADILSRLMLIARGRIEIARRGVATARQSNLKLLRARYPDAFSFALLSNLSDTILKVVQQLDVFVIAAILAPAEAGFYRLIKIFGSVLTMAATSIGQVIYPEIARLHVVDRAALSDFLRGLWKILALGAVSGFAVYAVIGEYAIDVIFGPDFLQVYVPSIIYMAGAALSLLCLPVTPLLLVRGQQTQLLVAYSVAAGFYLAVLSAGATLSGLTGAAFAFPALYVAYILVTVPILRRTPSHHDNSHRGSRIP